MRLSFLTYLVHFQTPNHQGDAMTIADLLREVTVTAKINKEVEQQEKDRRQLTLISQDFPITVEGAFAEILKEAREAALKGQCTLLKEWKYDLSNDLHRQLSDESRLVKAFVQSFMAQVCHRLHAAGFKTNSYTGNVDVPEFPPVYIEFNIRITW
jgi:acyl-homoserine lactone acylase PvdQ